MKTIRLNVVMIYVVVNNVIDFMKALMKMNEF
jgi:hypothetical protein